MFSLFLVMLGGAFGSGARYLTGVAMLRLCGPNFPYGTLTVNLVGGLAMGLLVGTIARLSVPGENWRLLLAVGVLGGYTTFSSFSLDVANMLQRGDLTTALGYILLSVIGAIGALFLGLILTRVAA
ncbi:fluoride efflux transporter CrcB [Sphingomonas sp. RT2P30]|uniref:fluoride efflux transporter CrcB n=1 Tax=Parasphingomonas halimpatiens TaxID=3096162 RepID=UPI002FC977A1